MKFVKEHGLTTRHTILTDEQQQIFEGLVLSDGCIQKPCVTPRFELRSITRSFITDIQNKLPFEYSPIHTVKASKKYENGILVNRKEAYTLYTKSDIFLIKEHQRWYPEGKKIIPKDLILTPTVLKYWFYGDGHTSKDGRNKNRVRLSLCTHGFSYKEVEWLIQKLKQDCHLDGFTMQLSCKHAPIIVSNAIKLVNRFFDYVGDCDIEGFMYKWKRPYEIVRNCTGATKKSITINGVTYISQHDAAKALKLSDSTFSNRVKRGIYEKS